MRTINHGSEYWKLHNDGAIERPGLVMPDAATWRISSAVERNNFGYCVRRFSLEEILSDPAGIPWHFANGKQRVFVQDIDHGTLREWRSPNHTIF